MRHILPTEGKNEVVTGDLGAGKTALFCEYGFDQLCAGGWTFSNVEWYPDEVAKRMRDERGLKFRPERLVDLRGASVEDYLKGIKRGSSKNPVLVGMDEAHFEISAREWKRNEERVEPFVHLATLARKLDIWFVFITQDGDDCDNAVRKKFTTETLCRNMKEERFVGVSLPFLPYFRTKFKLQKGRQHHKIGTEYVWRCSSWGLYNSKALLGKKAAQFEAMEVADCSHLEKARPQSRGSGWWAAAACATTAATLLLQ